ncbi:hypothetical protein ACMU_15220 [Actibacterium mucosum KCTC 23349]|uniref:HTH lysR-type domain-containing protein n=1 Tax=Actibacterium mucosum KCTC 23349 TaxID=1454373 RepID=A0A037ZHJ9_9RHOB|nr:LysR family transcriptional regulator [Actibacterium mucosum]KAJ55104.1 hypothetical protein ACMU_15220 [Actibacterium mucosum KCTC 23349]
MHDTDWDRIRIFLEAMRAGSLRGASEKLGVNHATINRAISRLEETYGTRLFDRSAGGLSLTQPGEALVEHAEEMEAQAFQIARKISGLDSHPSGVVRVSISPSLAHRFFAPILAGFSEAFPDIDVRLIATNQRSNLARMEADVSIRVADRVSDDVVGRRAVKFVQAVYAAPEYVQRVGPLTLGDGTGAHWINFRSDPKWIKASPFPNAKPRHLIPEITMQIEAAAEGVGMVLVPTFIGDADPRIVRVPDIPIQPGYSIWLLLHDDLRHSARVRAFVDFTAQYISERKRMFTR